MSAEKSVPDCAICGAKVSACWLAQARDYVTDELFSVWRCAVCDVAATVPHPASLDPYYSAQYRRYNWFTASTLRWLYRWRAGRWTRDLAKAGIVLEIGCGEGWMLAALRSKGWRVVGSERTLEAARPARGGQNLPIFVGSLDAVCPDQRFDAIVLFHALEHMTAPMDLLRQCAGLLKPGGTLIVAVPNAQSWQARIFGAHWFHLDVPRHLFHFSPQALTWAFRAAGLEPDLPMFASFEHDPYGWLQSLLNRLGLPQNRLTKALMGSEGVRRFRVALVGLSGLAALLTVPSVIIAACSWMASAGAVMEMRAKKPV